ncbi:hypothetical protein ACOSP7_028641 [Xanthoceras sorbifolium]
MEDESSSSNTNAGEQGGVTGYKCPRCSREFKSGQIRGGHQNPPATEVQPDIKAGADGSSSEQQNNAVQPNPKAKRGSSSSEPRPYNKPQLELRTIDYLAEWNSTWNVEDDAASSSANTSSELQLFPTNPDKPDLELKLG